MAEKRIVRPPADDQWKVQVSRVLAKLVGGVPEDSTAASVDDLRADFNELLALLRGLTAR